MARKKIAAPAVVPAEQIAALVVDKSGSMQVCTQAVIDGYNEFLGSLRADKSKRTTLTVTFFDTVANVVHAGCLPAEAPDLKPHTYVPEGCTALLDAIGKTLSAIDAETAGKTAPPVVVCIITDGQENSSREFTLEQVQQAIKDRQARGNWTFVFMGQKQTAWADAQKYGIPQGNVKGFDASIETHAAFAANTASYVTHSQSGASATTRYFAPVAPPDDPAEAADALVVRSISGTGKLPAGRR